MRIILQEIEAALLGATLHLNVMDDALNLDAKRFCRDVLQAVSRWYAANENEPVVQANIGRLFRFYPNGLPPYIVGVPLIS
jgi:hypothetical protein